MKELEFYRDPSGTRDEQKRYGKILYQDQEFNFLGQIVDKQYKDAKCMMPIIIALFLLVFSSIFLEYDCTGFFILFFIIFTFVVIFLVLLQKPYPFTVYENGIRFSTGNAPFVYFDDIIEFEERKMVGSGEPFIWIRVKSGEIYRIASVFNPSILEKPQNYLEVLRILKSKMKSLKPHAYEPVVEGEPKGPELVEVRADVDKEMRDIYWTPEANLEFRKVVVDKDMFERGIVDYIHSQRKTRVEKEDIHKVVENSIYLRISEKPVVKKVKRKKSSKMRKKVKTDISGIADGEQPPKFLEEIFH